MDGYNYLEYVVCDCPQKVFFPLHFLGLFGVQCRGHALEVDNGNQQPPSIARRECEDNLMGAHPAFVF